MAVGAFSYDTRLSTPKDEVRLKLYDIDPSSFEFSDNEINAVLSKSNNDILQATLVLAKSLVFKYTKLATSKKAGPYSESTESRANMYRELVASLLDEADEPWDEVAEFTHGDPVDPYRGKDEQDLLNREYRRGEI